MDRRSQDLGVVVVMESNSIARYLMSHLHKDLVGILTHPNPYDLGTWCEEDPWTECRLAKNDCTIPQRRFSQGPFRIHGTATRGQPDFYKDH